MKTHEKPLQTYLVNRLDSIFGVKKDTNLQMLLDHLEWTTNTRRKQLRYGIT